MTDRLRTVVHLIHGTWPYGFLRHLFRVSNRGCVAWFEATSDFCKAVQNSSDGDVEFVTFRWSGKNSFTARHKAAQELRAHLDQWLVLPNTRHVIVAHSHGGTVAFQALANYLTTASKNLKALYTLATPFVGLRPEAASERWRISTLFVGPVAAISALVAWFWSTHESTTSHIITVIIVFPSLFGIAMLTVAAFMKLFRKYVPSRKLVPTLWLPDTATFPCAVTAFRVPGDEASNAIAAAQVVDFIFGRLLSTVIARSLDWLRTVRSRPMGTLLVMIAAEVSGGALVWWVQWMDGATVEILAFFMGGFLYRSLLAA
jgi:pimeloyl-ACP methyl ester carboxylesterase